MYIYDYWDNCDKFELLQSVQRQTWGLRTCLHGLTFATYREYDMANIQKILTLLRNGHFALNQFCNLFFNLQRNLADDDMETCKPYQKVNLYAMEIVELVDSFLTVIEYFDDSQRVLIVFLRVLFKLRTPVEKYLVAVNYWNLSKR